MGIFSILAMAAGMLMGGALLGLLPLLVGRSTGKPELGKLGMLCSTISGIIFLSLPVAVGFLIAILVRSEDVYLRRGASSYRYGPTPTRPEGSSPRGHLSVACLSGPLRGQIYPLGTAGVVIGRDSTCGIRLPDGTPGVSSRHCCVRWQQGVPVLIDLNSTYGTFQGDGRQLPPNYPMPLAAGSRFYLSSNANCLFQIKLT